MSPAKDVSFTDTSPVSAAGDPASQALSPRRRVLLLVYHRDGVETAQILPGPGLVIGREPPADVIVRDRSLSRRHARFTLSGDKVTVEDLGSLNGTYVAGSRVERAAVTEGEEIKLGALTAAIHVLASAGMPSLGLSSHDAFRAAVEQEVVRAGFFGRSFALLTVRPTDHESGHVRHWFAKVRELARPVDRAALYSHDTVEILLPEIAPEKAREAASALVARASAPPLACGVAMFPDAATTAEELLQASREAAMQAGTAEPVRFASQAASREWIAASPGQGESRLLTNSPVMRGVVETATRLSRSSIPVLLLGETGTGKEVLSRFIHDSGPRAQKPMVCVNCGSIPAQLVESTLFGHERGAFTNAVQQQRGVFEAAEGGTVLLDEIGELPMPAQTALLRVLESKRVTRVGSTKEIAVDVRVIAATHRDLEAMIEAGTFRADLFYRLNVMTLKIPPLRARREDVEPLVRLFLEQANRANGCAVRALAPAALASLQAYSWPGNIRELRNAIERAVVIAEGDVVTVEDLPERVRAGLAPRQEEERSADSARGAPPAAPEAGSPREAGSLTMKSRLERAEQDAILDALRLTDGNQTEAARLLDMPLRTLQHKIKSHGIKRLGYGVAGS
jgi:DNA-binding NtrC family response regulator